MRSIIINPDEELCWARMLEEVVEAHGMADARALAA
jgi:hypothetical protein